MLAAYFLNFFMFFRSTGKGHTVAAADILTNSRTPPKRKDTLKKQNRDPASAVTILRGAANQKTGSQTSEAFAIRKRRKTFAVEMDAP